jgi:CheY-like chemotaxis protein
MVRASDTPALRSECLTVPLTLPSDPIRAESRPLETWERCFSYRDTLPHGDSAGGGRAVTDETSAPTMMRAPEAVSGPEDALRGMRVLVVEDNALVASSLALLLKTAGIHTIGPVGRLALAVRLATTASFDAAVLDIKLNQEPVWAVADVLAARRIPFAFATGYDAEVMLPPRYADAPVLSKPHSDRALFAVLRTLLAGSSGGGSAAFM